jgi:hypothetical protein
MQERGCGLRTAEVTLEGWRRADGTEGEALERHETGAWGDPQREWRRETGDGELAKRKRDVEAI